MHVTQLVGSRIKPFVTPIECLGNWLIVRAGGRAVSHARRRRCLNEECPHQMQTALCIFNRPQRIACFGSNGFSLFGTIDRLVNRIGTRSVGCYLGVLIPYITIIDEIN